MASDSDLEDGEKKSGTEKKKEQGKTKTLMQMRDTRLLRLTAAFYRASSPRLIGLDFYLSACYVICLCLLPSLVCG